MVTIRKATKEQIDQALHMTNGLFDGNVIFNRFDATGKNFNVTLKVQNSKGLGARLGFPVYDWATKCMIKKGKHMSAACWHVYGTFFDNLLSLNENIEIVSNGVKITSINGMNWQDRNIGSQAFPLYYSEACECDEYGIEISERF